MAVPTNTPQGGITWDFTITEQLKVSRYGHRGADFFKQFLPYGLIMPDQHPPIKINERTYQIARRLFKGEKVKLGSSK
jgi:hypothetical protein